MQKASDQVRVNVQLINALTDAHLWAGAHDRKLTDIFAIESDIAKTIAETLQAKLTGSEKSSIAKVPTTNPEAYELYLKGRFFWNKRTAEDLRKAIDYFNAAIAKDPDYALAYAAVAQSWLILPAYGGGSPRECIPPAEAAISKALELDESSSDAHAARGMLLAGYQFDYPAGKKEYERALELNPNDATAHHWFATDVLAALGDSEAEIAKMRRARDLDLSRSSSIPTWEQLCFARVASTKRSPSCAGRWLWTTGSGMVARRSGWRSSSMDRFRKRSPSIRQRSRWILLLPTSVFSGMSTARLAARTRPQNSSAKFRTSVSLVTWIHTFSRLSIWAWGTARRR